MKLKDMLLITHNHKGTEGKYLLSIQDYLSILSVDFERTEPELGHWIEELLSTKDNQLWTEIYLAANKTICARFCESEQELRQFLLGQHRMLDKGIPFLQEHCSKACLEALTAYDMDTAGHPLVGKLHYEVQRDTFRQGEALHNFNGSDYAVLQVLDRDHLLLMALKSGQFVIAAGTRAYARYPKEGFLAEDSVIQGISWEHGIYLGNNLLAIDLERIQQEYGQDEISEEENGMEEEEAER